MFRETAARVADKKGLNGKAKNIFDCEVELLFVFGKETDKECIKQCVAKAPEKTVEEGY